MKREELDYYFNESRLEWMRAGRAYYAGQNDIVKRERVVFVRGQAIRLSHLSNNRIAHPFLRKLTDQKVAYLLSQPFSVQTDDEGLAARLSEFFDKAFFKTLQAIGRDAVICGVGWLQVYYTPEGDLRIKRIAPETVAPVYDSGDLDQLKAVIRRYPLNDSVAYEVWNADGVTYSIADGGDLAVAESTGHFTVGDESFSWDRLPLIPFRYNPESRPLLMLIKSLIDDYDARVSDVANLLSDSPNCTKIIKGHVEDPEVFVRNLATLNCLFVGEGGSVENLDTKIDIEAHNAHLDRLRKDIYDAGSGVDTQETTAGDLSGTAIRFRYSELELDCKMMGTEFAEALETLIWFICEDMRQRGEGDHEAKSVNIVWNTDHIINELQTVQVLSASRGLISDATIIENHPYVTDAEAEKRRIAEEMEDEN